MKKILCAAAMSFVAINVAYAEHHEGGEHMMMEPPELTGAFSSEDGFVGTFMPAGYLVVANNMGVAGIVIKYGAKDGVAWFKDVTPPPEADAESADCVMSNKGKYNYTLDGDNLTFSLIEDPCEGRVEAVTSANLTRMEMPEAEGDE